jgi:hypothetical protein
MYAIKILYKNKSAVGLIKWIDDEARAQVSYLTENVFTRSLSIKWPRAVRRVVKVTQSFKRCRRDRDGNRCRCGLRDVECSCDVVG